MMVDNGLPVSHPGRHLLLASVEPSMSDAGSPVRPYYRTIDEGDYETLADLLTPGFRQVRGDRTIEGREAFVRFMRDDRPETDTTHEVDAVYRRDSDAESPDEVAVRGRLRRGDGSVWFGFVDVFELDDGRLDRLVTYSNQRVE